MAKNSDNSLDQRSQYFLKALIEHYITDGQPVGSRTLARNQDLKLSPATVRNVMADLEDSGFILSPHTSAGRIPTVPGYRVFVDSLISLQPVEKQLAMRIQEQLLDAEDEEQVISSASQLLANMTKMAGVVMVPRHVRVVVTELQFLALSDNRVLVVLVNSKGEVQNRVFETTEKFTRSSLERASNYINAHFAGAELETMRLNIVKAMSKDRNDMDELIAQSLKMADLAMQDADDEDYVLTGQTNLMGFDEFAQLDELRQIFEAFSEKQHILHLLDSCRQAEGIQIFIGEESGYGALEKCSVITAPYGNGDEIAGVMAVIGPTRMAYDKVIPIVDITANFLSVALKSGQ